MYMNGIKLFVKNEKELETQIHEVWIYSQDIGMKFSVEKYIMLEMKSGKRHLTDGMELPNQEKIRTLEEKKTYKYFGVLFDTSGDERKKLRESISGEPETYLRQNYIAETLSKE